MAIRAPSCASRRASPRPMPLLPPVTKATRLRSDIRLPGKNSWKDFQYSLVPFQLIAPNFAEPRGKSLFEVAPSSPRLQVTFPPTRVLHAQTALLVDQSQRTPIGGGTHLPLVALLQAFSQIAGAADVEFAIPLAQQNIGVFHQSLQPMAQEVGTALAVAGSYRSRATITVISSACSGVPAHSSAAAISDSATIRGAAPCTWTAASCKRRIPNSSP